MYHIVIYDKEGSVLTVAVEDNLENAQAWIKQTISNFENNLPEPPDYFDRKN